MTEQKSNELRRRSLVKSLLWRVIGIVWTWVGAYIILLLLPPARRSAALIATLIVVYHHSTRMIMYYAYERIWASVAWGRGAAAQPMSGREKLVWAVGTALALLLIFYLLLEVHPKIKRKQSAQSSVEMTTERPIRRRAGLEVLEQGRRHRRPGGEIPVLSPDRNRLADIPHDPNRHQHDRRQVGLRELRSIASGTRRDFC